MAIKCPEINHSLGRLIQKISIIVQTLIVFIITLIFLPLILFLLTPIYLFRFIVFKLTPYFRPNFGKILSTRSAMFASDDIYHKPLCTLIGQLVSEGDVDISRFRRIVQENFVDGTFANGELKHPELKQYVTQWLGFCFWKNEKAFKVEEHAKLVDLTDLDSYMMSKSNSNYKTNNNNFVTESKVCEIMSYLSTAPFNEGKSPWEIIFIPNFVHDCNDDGKIKNVMIFRWHHCLMDGLSMLKLLTGITTLDVNSIPQSKTIDSNKIETEKRELVTKRIQTPGFVKLISTIISAPYVLVKTSIESMDPTASNSWHIPENELAKKWKSVLSDTFVTTDFIKTIKDHYEVSFSAVLLTGFSGALRNFMLRDESKKLPDFIHIGIPFPFKGHPDKLRNYWSICTVKLPIKEKSSVKRLHYIERKLERLKASPAPLVTFLLMSLIGGLFNCMVRPLVKNINTTAIVSIMPGPEKELNNYKGGRGLHLEFFVSLGGGNGGFGFSCLSYNGSVRVATTVDTELFSDISNIKDMANGVLHELDILKELIKAEV